MTRQKQRPLMPNSIMRNEDSTMNKQATNSVNEDSRKEGGKRAEETRARRRRRAEASYEGHVRLTVNEDLLDRDNFAYRWVNDTTDRIRRFTKDDDWDKVTDTDIKENSNSQGAEVRQLVGSNEDGSPLYAYLLRKPIEFHREDRALKQKRIDETEKSIKRGVHAGGEALSADNDKGYVPKAGISMSESKGGTEYKP